MIRSLLLLTAGTAAGWFAHRTVEAGQRAAEQEAGRRVRETLDPTRLGRSAGQAVGDAAAEAVAQGTQAFTDRLRSEAPPWVSQLLDQARTTVSGETVPGPGAPGSGARASSRVTIPGETIDASTDPRTDHSTPKDTRA